MALFQTYEKDNININSLFEKNTGSKIIDHNRSNNQFDIVNMIPLISSNGILELNPSYNNKSANGKVK